MSQDQPLPWLSPGDHRSAVLLHVPHSSRAIPPRVREGLLLDGPGLDAELDAMTDRHTAELAAALADAMDVRPWIAVNPWSRLVVDPERFLDEREEMNLVGMGAVYHRTSTGQPLRRSDSARDEQLLEEYFHPYAQALSEATAALLARHGRVLVLDLHSYPLEPLPYELHKSEQRPEVCIGADATHTSQGLLSAVRATLSRDFTTSVNEPFHGCYIPNPYYGIEPRVQGLMIELRRDVGDERGRLALLADALATALNDR